MKVHIMSTGSEITAGKSIDTNSAWIANELFELGFQVERFVVLGDDPHAIRLEIEFIMAKEEENLIIITGGLGATADDYTLQVILEITGRNKKTFQPAMEKLERLSRLRGKTFRDIIPMAKRQTLIPEGCIVLMNDTGIAPGFFLELNDNTNFAAFPGVPIEMKKMFSERFIPVIQQIYQKEERFASSVCIWGLSESVFQETFVKANLDLIQKGIEWGVTAKPGYIKFTFRAYQEDLIDEMYDLVTKEYKNLIGNNVFQDIHDKLIEDKKTLATSESCTGGYIAKKITDVSGSSNYFLGSVVAYNNRIKTQILNVKQDTLEKYGAVSEETATEMVEGLEKLFQSDYSISVTGIAGPSGGTQEKKVGLVYIGLKVKGEEVEVKQFELPLGRELFREYVSNFALFLLYKKMIN